MALTTTTATTTTGTPAPRKTEAPDIDIVEEEEEEDDGDSDSSSGVGQGSQADELEALARGLKSAMAWIRSKEFADLLDHAFGSLPTFATSFLTTAILFMAGAGVAPVIRPAERDAAWRGDD